MTRLARGLATGVMVFCAVGAVSSAVVQTLGGIVFYVAIFVIVGVVRTELAQ